MKVIDRLPYSAEPATLMVRGEVVRVRPFQIVVWLSVSIEPQATWDSRTPRLPAILDTGSNFNFAIGRGHLLRWAGLDPRLLPYLGAVRERGQRLPLHAAVLWLHPNRKGTGDVANGREPARLELRQGMVIYPDETAPRLPLLGLPALTRNRLRTVIDGDRMQVSIRTALPRWWPFA